MIISKVFFTWKKAEKFQNSLYNKYDKVELMSAPCYSEEGEYLWNVK